MSAETGLRPNHYATLGLDPEASQDQVEEAFRRSLNPFVPHVLGGVAAASAAYATLRDPVKRRAYDEANGFLAPLKTSPVADNASGAAWAIGNKHMMRAVPRRAQDFTPEPLSAPFMAAPTAPIEETSATVAPRPRPAPTPFLQHRPTKARPKLGRPDGPRPAPVILGIDEAEVMAINQRKGLIIVGAIAAVALSGGLLGWIAGSDADEARANGVVSSLPKAEPRELSIITPVEDVTAPGTEPMAQRSAAKARSRAAPTPRSVARVTTAETPVAEEAIALDEPQADPLAPQPIEAAMPLPAATVARTIDRIGYSCGSVTGTTSAGDGVFTVTCSSGQRFRASPRAGRYRFKRI